jgi:hypothetical protein
MANVNEQIDTLGDALPREMTRVRDHVLPAYVAIGRPGLFAATGMRLALDRAARAMIEGDVADMIRAYDELKGFDV